MPAVLERARDRASLASRLPSNVDGPFGVGGDGWGSARVQPLIVGTPVVDIPDARTGAIVWRSLASSDIRLADKPEDRDQKVTKATVATPRGAFQARIAAPVDRAAFA
jgi:hypothetical protein